MKNVLEISKQTDNEFINLYKIKYLDDCSTCTYEFASRRAEKDLTALNPQDKVDAVKILPYFYEDGRIYVVLLDEFRRPLNKSIFGVVAGLVEDGEEPVIAAQREIYEEIGGQTLNIEQIDVGSYVSAGLTDEKLAHFIAEVRLEGRQHLEETEDIRLKIIPLDEALDFCKTHEFCVSGLLLLQMFYYKMKNS